MKANISAASAATPANPLTVHFLGNLLTFRARAGDTSGHFSVVECLTAPGAGSPPHLQNDEEAFLVLEGRFDFILGDEVRNCGAGEFVYIKPGTPHAFRNSETTPSKMLIINLPGGLHEGFFLEVGEEVASAEVGFPPIGAPDVPRIAAAAARYGIELLPPKGA